MNLKQLEFAVALAEERHFTRAAERCHVVQSALSHQIARLEAELGATLFERLPRQVRITPAGEALLVHARQALAAVERLQQDVAAAVGAIRGTLTLGLISSVPRLDIVDLLATFHARHPQVDIRLRQDKSGTLLAAVRERQLDFALIGLSRQVALEAVDSRLLLSEELVAVLPAAHGLAGRERLSLHELVDLPLVDLPRAAARGGRPTKPSRPGPAPSGAFRDGQHAVAGALRPPRPGDRPGAQVSPAPLPAWPGCRSAMRPSVTSMPSGRPCRRRRPGNFSRYWKRRWRISCRASVGRRVTRSDSLAAALAKLSGPLPPKRFQPCRSRASYRTSPAQLAAA